MLKLNPGDPKPSQQYQIYENIQNQQFTTNDQVNLCYELGLNTSKYSFE